MKFPLMAFLYAGCLSCLISFCVCSDNPGKVAGGTETGNPQAFSRIRGSIVGSTGIPQAQVTVSLYPSNYNSVKHDSSLTIVSDTTDSLGCFALTAHAPGTYNLSGQDLPSGRSTFRKNLLIAASETLTLAADTLRSPGAIRIPIDSAALMANTYLYIPGTDIAVYVPDTGIVILDSVPSGRMDILYYNTVLDSSINLGAGYYNVAVASNDTTDLAPPVLSEKASLSCTWFKKDFNSFQFRVFDAYIPSVVIFGISGTDTLFITLSPIPSGTGALPLTNASVRIEGAIDSSRYTLTNQGPFSTGNVYGAINIVAMDTANTFRVNFPYASLIACFRNADSTTTLASISGTFSAMRIR